MKRWPIKKTYFWETAPFFRLTLPLAGGILLYDSSWLHGFSIQILLAIICSCLILYTVSLFIPDRKKKFPAVPFALLYAFLCSGGFALSYFSDIRNDSNWFGRHMPAVSLARVTDVPAEKDHSWKVSVSIIRTINGGVVAAATGNAFLYLYKDMPMLLHKGDTLLLPANWQFIKNAGNPFEFDYAAYCRRNNIFYQQSCSAKDIQLYSAADPDHAPVLERSHDWCMQQLDKYVPDAKTKGLLQAMLLGDEINLDEELLHSYADTGIVHIIAISGGNVAIFFMFICWALWWLKHKKYLWIKYLVALPLAWFYVLMAGAQPSAIRAAIMFSLLAFSILFRKNNNSLNTLFATAFLLLCAQPAWLFSIGFQLSFVAVLSLILFYKPVYKWLSPGNKPLRLLWETVSASIAAEVLVAPLVIYYFHTFPLMFIVSNVLAYLFMGLVLLLSILILVFYWFPWLAFLIGSFTVWLVTVFDNLILILQKWNPVSFHFLVLSEAELVMVYIVLAGISLFLLKKQKAMLLMSLIGGCLLVCLLCGDEWIRLQRQELIVYNTGKENHIELVTGRRYQVIYKDTVPDKKTEYAVKPAHTYLRAWEKDSLAEHEIFRIHGKTLLVLNHDVAEGKQFPADYLVVNYSRNIDPVKLQSIFHPAEMIIGNNIPRKQQLKLSDISRENQIPVYLIADSGAFIR